MKPSSAKEKTTSILVTVVKLYFDIILLIFYIIYTFKCLLTVKTDFYETYFLEVVKRLIFFIEISF